MPRESGAAAGVRGGPANRAPQPAARRQGAAGTAVGAASEHQPSKPCTPTPRAQGARLGRVAAAVVLGGAARLLVPMPPGLDPHVRGACRAACVHPSPHAGLRARMHLQAALSLANAQRPGTPLRSPAATSPPSAPSPPPASATCRRLAPPPPPRQAWDLLGFFVATVAGLVLEPLPPAAWALLCAAAATGCGALSFEEAFQAAGGQALWLIVSSFLLAKVCACRTVDSAASTPQ